MVSCICKNKMDPGNNTMEEGSSPHDCLSPLSPGGHLEVPLKDSTRCLRVVQAKAVLKATLKFELTLSDRAANKAKIKGMRKKALRQRCNRRRSSARVVGYRSSIFFVKRQFVRRVRPKQLGQLFCNVRRY